MTAPQTIGQVEIRRYPGKERQAYERFQADARSMAAAGWFPTAQSYVPGTWGCLAWIIAFILVVLVIGIIVLAYMIVARPAGELIVTYEFRGLTTSEPAPAAAPTATTASEDVYAQLGKLGELRDSGVITSEEFEAKKAELLGRL